MILVSCAGGESEEVRTEKFCREFANVLTVPKGAGSGDTADDTEREAAAAVKVVPGDAPRAVADYIRATREFVALSKVWDNPQTGGIKQEYVGDFQRLIGVLEDTTAPTAQFVGERCPGARLPQSLQSRLEGAPSGRPGGQAQAPSRPAEVRVLLPGGPAGSYERVTVEVGKVTATNAEPKAAGGANPTATGTNSLLVDVELEATTSIANVFRPTDFRLAGPSGTPIVASALLETGGEGSTVRLAGRDAAKRTVVFPTPELVRDLRGYALRIERDDRVPAVLPFGGAPNTAYPVTLAAGATGAFTVALTAVCTDQYRTTVRSAGADLDADLGRTRDTGRAKRGRRWFTVVLQVTNVTPAGACQAFSGNAGVVEMRLQADGQAVEPVNERSFDRVAVGATGDRVYVFEVSAGARSLVLLGHTGEVLGRWAAELPPAPGE